MAAPGKDEKEKLAPIIIKRVKKAGHGHHGGAWKVAYADFVTAMMAFFLLLWLLNVTTKEQKNAISDYFDPSHPKVSDVVSGAGGILGGMTVSVEGAMVSTVQPLIQTQQRVTTTHGELQGVKNPDGQEDAEAAKLQQELKEKEDKRFKDAADKLKAEIAKAPELKDLQQNILIDITPEGLRIQIVDDKGRSMFPSGSAVMYDFMRTILLKISGVVTALPNQVSVRGHTDSNKYKSPNTYDNWNLSADRAQASRRVLVSGGLPEGRIENVMGRSDREPLEKDPAAARNRRISIILLRHAPTADELKKQKEDDAKTSAEQKAVEGQKGQPVTIINDEFQGPMPQPKNSAQQPGAGQPPAQGTAPAQPGAKASANGTATMNAGPQPEYNQPQYSIPLPTTPAPETTIQRQPQVMYFGGANDDSKGSNDNGNDANAPLYQGPTVAPIQNKPPTIHTPLFELNQDDVPSAASSSQATPAPTPVPAAVVPSTPANKTITFGDAVPVQAAPTGRAILPPAPVMTLDNSKSSPAPVATAPQDDDTPAPTPESIVPNIVPPVQVPAGSAAPAPAQPSGKGKNLEF